MMAIYTIHVPRKFRAVSSGGSGMRLMGMLVDWAKSQKAEEIHLQSTSDIDPKRTDKMLTRVGLKT